MEVWTAPSGSRASHICALRAPCPPLWRLMREKWGPRAVTSAPAGWVLPLLGTKPSGDCSNTHPMCVQGSQKSQMTTTLLASPTPLSFVLRGSQWENLQDLGFFFPFLFQHFYMSWTRAISELICIFKSAGISVWKCMCFTVSAAISF